MIVVLQGMPETEKADWEQVSQLNISIDGRLTHIHARSAMQFKVVTNEGVFLTAKQVRELVHYGMSDSESSRMLVEFNKKQPQEAEVV